MKKRPFFAERPRMRGTGLEPVRLTTQVFHTTTVFTAHYGLWSGPYLLHVLQDSAGFQEVSIWPLHLPNRNVSICQAWLGIAMLQNNEGFTEFGNFYIELFSSSTQFSLRPVRLPLRHPRVYPYYNPLHSFPSTNFMKKPVFRCSGFRCSGKQRRRGKLYQQR